MRNGCSLLLLEQETGSTDKIDGSKPSRARWGFCGKCSRAVGLLAVEVMGAKPLYRIQAPLDEIMVEEQRDKCKGTSSALEIDYAARAGIRSRDVQGMLLRGGRVGCLGKCRAALQGGQVPAVGLLLAQRSRFPLFS